MLGCPITGLLLSKNIFINLMPHIPWCQRNSLDLSSCLTRAFPSSPCCSSPFPSSSSSSSSLSNSSLIYTGVKSAKEAALFLVALAKMEEEEMEKKVTELEAKMERMANSSSTTTLTTLWPVLGSPGMRPSERHDRDVWCLVPGELANW